MDNAQSDSSSKRKKKSNITRFRQDRRLAVVGALRSLALLLMLAVVVYGVWAYQDDLNLDNIQRLLSYAQAAGDAGDGFTRYRFEPGLDAVYAPFELGLAVVSSDTYRFATGFGEAGFSAQLKYASPEICVSSRQILIYDRGNLGYCVANGYALLHSGTSGSPIISATMNPNGDYALVTNESGYRAGIYVYDRKNREKCVWQTPAYYIQFASLSPDGERFAAACMGERDNQAYTQVRVYGIGGEEPLFTLDFGSRQIYSIKHYIDGSLFILCEDGLYIYDDTGQLAAQSAFTGVMRFRQHEGDLPLVALRASASGGERVTLRAYDPAGQIVFEQSVSGSLRDMDYRGGRGLLLFYDKLNILDLTGPAPALEARETGGARRVLCTDGEEGILIYSDRAEGISLSLAGGSGD